MYSKLIGSEIDIVESESNFVDKNTGFRAWFYFRQGWSVYFAFIFAAINMLTVTYFLAIERYPTLLNIFPTFPHYIGIAVIIGIPFLTLIGYVHYKRSASFKAEADINIEANPHTRRILLNTELLISANLKLTEMIITLSKNEKLSDFEVMELSKLHNKLSEHIKKRTIKE